MKKAIGAAALAAACAAPAAFAGEGLAGLYAGGNLGLGTATVTTEDSDCWYNCSAYTNRPSGVTFGVKVGQNFTSGSLLYGWDLDYDVGSASESYHYGYYAQPDLRMSATSEMKGLLSVKGKAGILVDKTALAAVFGFAQGDFDNEFKDRVGTVTNADDYAASSDGTVNGMVYGFALQHAWSDNLLISADIQRFSFDTDTTYFYDSAGTNQTYKVRFVNDVDQFRISVVYKFL